MLILKTQINSFQTIQVYDIIFTNWWNFIKKCETLSVFGSYYKIKIFNHSVEMIKKFISFWKALLKLIILGNWKQTTNRLICKVFYVELVNEANPKSFFHQKS
jgi:hypothetical protein